MRHAFCIACMASLCVFVASTRGGDAVQPATVSVTVAVEGVRGNRGTVRVGLFRRDGFPRNERAALHGTEISAASSNRVVVVANVPAGDYAILAYHDENGNGRLDYDFLGRPKEGYGVSNDARHAFRAPRYDEARVMVGADRSAFTLRLAY